MSVYSIIYCILSLILLVYVISHRLDLLCVASVCYIVYTIYCIPGIGISGFYRPKLSPSLYYCVYAQLLILLLVNILVRFREKRRKKLQVKSEPPRSSRDVLTVSFRLYTAVILFFALENIISVGFDGFKAGKGVVWEQTNVFYVISLYGAWPSFAYGIHKNDKLVWIPSLFIELTIFFAGSRAFTATIIILFLCEKGASLWKNRKKNFRIYLLGAMAVVFLLLYRMVDQYIMAGDFDGAISALGKGSTWLTALEFNEPRVIIANYDYAFTNGLRLPVGDVVYRIIDFVPGLTSLFHIDLAYPEYYSTWLQEQVHGSAGVGGSIWGESYAMFGYAGIFVFTLIWLAFICGCNKHLDYHEKYSYFIVSLGVYLAWYINRLDYNRVAQSCKVMLFCFLIWASAFLVIGGILKFGRIKIRI